MKCKHNTDLEEDFCPACSEEAKETWIEKHQMECFEDSIFQVPMGPEGEFYIRELFPRKMFVNKKHEAALVQMLKSFKEICEV